MRKFSINDTNVLKGVAIIMMYVHHMFLEPKRWGICNVDFLPLTQELTISIAVFGKICVSIFVFLTGYGLMRKYKPIICQGIREKYYFTLNRLYKLEINFIFIFVLTLIYSYLFQLNHFSNIYGKNTKAFIRCLLDGLGLAELFKTPTMNGTWWYMSLAIILIVLFVFIADLYKKYGVMILLLSLILPLALNLPYSHLNRYLPVLIVGIIFADLNVLENMSNKLIADRGFSIKWIIITSFGFVMLLILKKYIGYKAIPFFNMAVTPLIAIYTYTYVRHKYIRKGLEFLGKHSMNMFLIHTLIRHYWYHDFSYSFVNAWLDVIVLLGITISLSIAIEELKSITKYNKLIKIKIGG